MSIVRMIVTTVPEVLIQQFKIAPTIALLLAVANIAKIQLDNDCSWRPANTPTPNLTVPKRRSLV